MAKKTKPKPELEMTGDAPVAEKKVRKFTNKKGFEVDRLHPERFQIQAVKLSKKGGVTLDYFEKNANGNWDKKRQISAERPIPEFERILQSLSPEVGRICGFPAGYDEGMTIISVTYDGIGTDKVMTAAIACEKKLAEEKTLKIRTPAFPAPYEEADEDECLSHGCVEKLDHMWNQCVKYLLGERSQMKLEDQIDDDERELINEHDAPREPRAKRSVSPETEKVFGMEKAAA